MRCGWRRPMRGATRAVRSCPGWHDPARMTQWTALVLAGSRPGADPFAASHGTDLKALIPVAGEPMVRRPVGALLASGAIGSVRVLTQQAERIAAVLPANPRLTVEQSGE